MKYIHDLFRIIRNMSLVNALVKFTGMNAGNRYDAASLQDDNITEAEMTILEGPESEWCVKCEDGSYAEGGACRGSNMPCMCMSYNAVKHRWKEWDRMSGNGALTRQVHKKRKRLIPSNSLESCPGSTVRHTEKH